MNESIRPDRHRGARSPLDEGPNGSADEHNAGEQSLIERHGGRRHLQHEHEKQQERSDGVPRHTATRTERKWLLLRLYTGRAQDRSRGRTVRNDESPRRKNSLRLPRGREKNSKRPFRRRFEAAAQKAVRNGDLGLAEEKLARRNSESNDPVFDRVAPMNDLAVEAIARTDFAHDSSLTNFS